MLQSTPEIQLADSLHIDSGEWKLHLLDTSDVKKWFSPILGSTTNNRFKNRGYDLAGKITTNTQFKLVILDETKKEKPGKERRKKTGNKNIK